MEYRPRIVSWNITAACNLRCPHCYLDAGRRRYGELTTREALRLIDQMAEAGTELLILTGGEPLLRRDLLVLARSAAEKGIRVVLGTTGTLITLSKAKMLREKGVRAVGISIDSTDASKHDSFRGVPGAWQRAVQGMDASLESGLDVLVHTTALRMNYEEIPSIVQFAYAKGARAFHLFFLVCTGRGQRLTDLSPQDYEALLVFILDAQERYPGMMVRARCAPYIQRLALERGLVLPWSGGCLAGTSYCRITPDGSITPCPYLPISVANLREQPFEEIWESSAVLARFRRPLLQLKGKCGLCPFSQGDEPLCVGCRARAFALAGDEMAADLWCLYQPEQGNEASLGDISSEAEAQKQLATRAPIGWTEEARQRISRVPFFIRGRVQQAAETYVRKHGIPEVTCQVLDHLRQRAYGGGPSAGKSKPFPNAASRDTASES